MSLPQDFYLYGVKSLMIAPLLTDVKATATTYGSWMAVTGVKSIAETPKIVTSTATGDEITLAVFNTFQQFDITFDNAVMNLSVIAAINGGTVTDTGTSTTETDTYNYDGLSGINNYFKMAFLDKSGTILTTYYKVNGYLTVNQKENTVATCSFKGIALTTTGQVNGNQICKSVVNAASAQTISS